jgi:hypothetical protein
MDTTNAALAETLYKAQIGEVASQREAELAASPRESLQQPVIAGVYIAAFLAALLVFLHPLPLTVWRKVYKPREYERLERSVRRRIARLPAVVRNEMHRVLASPSEVRADRLHAMSAHASTRAASKVLVAIEAEPRLRLPAMEVLQRVEYGHGSKKSEDSPRSVQGESSRWSGSSRIVK